MKAEMNSRRQYVIPVFDPIKLGDIKSGSAILVYGRSCGKIYTLVEQRQLFDRLAWRSGENAWCVDREQGCDSTTQMLCKVGSNPAASRSNLTRGLYGKNKTDREEGGIDGQ